MSFIKYVLIQPPSTAKGSSVIHKLARSLAKKRLQLQVLQGCKRFEISSMADLKEGLLSIKDNNRLVFVYHSITLLTVMLIRRFNS
ncbi:MAG: hypothetical protein R2816_07600 [Flavobacteriaceae bacterium]